MSAKSECPQIWWCTRLMIVLASVQGRTWRADSLIVAFTGTSTLLHKREVCMRSRRSILMNVNAILSSLRFCSTSQGNPIRQTLPYSVPFWSVTHCDLPSRTRWRVQIVVITSASKGTEIEPMTRWASESWSQTPYRQTQHSCRASRIDSSVPFRWGSNISVTKARKTSTMAE